MCRSNLSIRFQGSDRCSLRLDLCREFGQQLVLQPEFLALVVCFQDPEFCHLHVQVHLFFDERIAGTQRLDLRIGESLLVHILTGAHRAFAGHDLGDKPLLVLQSLPEVGVKCPFRDVIINVNLFVLITLTNNSAIALGFHPTSK